MRARKFKENICRVVGHEFKEWGPCKRCGYNGFVDLLASSKGLNKIASAMSVPLKTSLDYRKIIRKSDETSK